MTRIISQQDVSWFLDLNDKGQLDLDPPYQRRSVWTSKDKRFFIDTVLNNYPAPPIFLHKTLDDHGHVTYHVVDGKQRLQTIIEFSENRIRIPDNFSDVSLQKKRWSDLQRETRAVFWNYILIVEMLPSINEATIRDTFERINRNSRKLARQEIRHAKYDGWFIRTAETDAEKDEWRDYGLVSISRVRRMSDVQFISELFAINLKMKLNGFDQDWLDALYAEYDDPDGNGLFVPEDFLGTVQRTKSIISKVLDTVPDIVTYSKVVTHFYTLWGFISLRTNDDFNPQNFATAYFDFMTSVTNEIKAGNTEGAQAGVEDTVRIYAANSRGASTDLVPRQARQDQLIRAMAGLPGVIHEDS